MLNDKFFFLSDSVQKTLDNFPLKSLKLVNLIILGFFIFDIISFIYILNHKL